MTPSSFGDLIPKVLRETTKRHEVMHRMQVEWPRIVGKALAGRSKPVAIRRKRLYVHISEPAASFELTMKKPHVLAKAHTIVGEELVDLVLRAGSIDESR